VAYELLGYAGQIDDITMAVVQHYADGRLAYGNRRWDEAMDHFSAALSRDPHDGPSLTMLSRCKAFKVRPPGDDWRGVFTLTSK
jgi:adenylate cyclase